MKIIAVSYLTKNLITHHYGIDPGKVEESDAWQV